MAVGQSAALNDGAGDLVRAEQLYDQANYLQAANILEPLLDNATREPGTSGETAAATRLLAQVYYRSADYARAAEVAERHARLAPHPDAEILLVLADSYLVLGRYDEAGRQLEKFRAAFGDAPVSDVQEARLAIDAHRIAAAMRRATHDRDANVAAQQLASPDFTAALTISPERYQAAQRFQAATLLVDRCLNADRVEDAIAILTSETSAPAHDAHSLAELNLQLANCYQRQALQLQEAGNEAAQQTAIANEDRVLNRLTTDLNRRRIQLLTNESAQERQGGRAEQAEDFAKLLPQQATVLELQAELARDASRSDGKPAMRLVAKHLTQAAMHYRQLLQLAAELDHGRAGHYRDVALCGLQRVYDGLRLTTDVPGQDHLVAGLRRVSDELVAQRSARLLRTDPALYDAKRAQASIYASGDDPESHQRAAEVYRELVAFWDSSPRSDPPAQAAALIGLAEMLRALNQTREAYATAQRARRVVAESPADDDTASRRAHALLAARIDNSLAVTSISLGQYRDALHFLVEADRRLKPYGDSVAGVSDLGFNELRRKNQQALHVLSRVKVYRGLLHKAEAQYDDAATRVREGRELRERLDDDADLLAYYLAEASVHLAQAHALMQEGRMTADHPPIRAGIASAESALDNARPFTEARQDTNEPRQTSAALPYRYLRGLLLRLRDHRDESRQVFAALAKDSVRYGDGKTAAKSYMQLAQLAAEGIPKAPSVDSTRSANEGSTVLSRIEAEKLRRNKLDRRAALHEAAGYAAQAVELYRQMDRHADADDQIDEDTVTAFPSLHFQASYLAARLHVLLTTLDIHLQQLNELLAPGELANTEDPQQAGLIAADFQAAEQRNLAIGFLEDAVRQAERPASSTTQVRLQRAKFFSRYAPAYDLLVDLHVAAAVGNGDHLRAEPASDAFVHLRRAMEVADLARNRTFREQIDGWRESAGNARVSQTLDWNADIARLAAPHTAVLVYHLDGPQLLDAGSGQLGARVARIGGGHLFVIPGGGQEIQYYRLLHTAPDATQPSDLTRQFAADLVRRHIAWIERPEVASDWGRAEQRALTEALLPRALLDLLVKASAVDSSAPIRELLVICDGALHQLPFESLLLPQGIAARREIRYVLDELPPIRYGPSLSVLAAISKGAGQGVPAPARLLTVGNPAYPDRGRQTKIPAWGELFRQVPGYQGGFPALAHSEQECESVYASFDELSADRRTKLVRGAATEAAVRQSLAASRFIHLAAHGCVDYQNDNLFGALVLAPGDDPSDPRNDGILQLRDIYGLDLSGCELAVLSACQTYVGPERPLEAGTSMARAFLEQGAKRVVCSQWSTDDEATTELMTEFFASIRRARQAGENVDYALALHEAKRALRRHPDRRSRPRYWSPFVLVGAP